MTSTRFRPYQKFHDFYDCWSHFSEGETWSSKKSLNQYVAEQDLEWRCSYLDLINRLTTSCKTTYEPFQTGEKQAPTLCRNFWLLPITYKGEKKPLDAIQNLFSLLSLLFSVLFPSVPLYMPFSAASLVYPLSPKHPQSLLLLGLMWLPTPNFSVNPNHSSKHNYPQITLGVLGPQWFLHLHPHLVSCHSHGAHAHLHYHLSATGSLATGSPSSLISTPALQLLQSLAPSRRFCKHV